MKIMGPYLRPCFDKLTVWCQLNVSKIYSAITVRTTYVLIYIWKMYFVKLLRNFITDIQSSLFNIQYWFKLFCSKAYQNLFLW